MSALISRHVTQSILALTSIAIAPLCLAQSNSHPASPNAVNANTVNANSASTDKTAAEDTGADEFASPEKAKTSDSLASPNAANEHKDPWEHVNRKVFVFNTFLDDWLLRPLAVSYHTILPDPVETGIANAFANLLEPANIINDILQWKWQAAGRDLGRVVVNTTAGVGGLWDVATYIGWKNTGGEDFGQTLRVWGVPQGPYLMIPFLGPSTTADFAGYPLDLLTSPLTYVESPRAKNSLNALNLVHKRAGFLSSEELITGDKYSFIRDAYLQNREFKTNDGQVEDDFGMTPLDDF